MDRRTLLTGTAVGVSATVGGCLGIGPDEHYTRVRPADQAEIDEARPVHPFEDLSEEGQDVFLNAKNASGERYTFTGADNRPPEFEYYDDTSWYTLVRYEGQLYKVLTIREDTLL